MRDERSPSLPDPTSSPPPTKRLPTFEWRTPDERSHHYPGVQTGVIAQEVEKVFPRWVHEDPETHYKVVEPDERTMLALTVEALRTLKLENDKRKAENDELRARMDLGSVPHAGFRFPTGNAGYGVAGILFGFLVADKLRKKKDEKAA